MNDVSFFDAPELKTGNAFVDHMNAARLSMMPEFWALVCYLEEKGVVDGKEFLE